MLLALLLLIERATAMPRVPLQEAAEKTLCPYSYRKDVLESRTPRVIHKVECHGKEEFGQRVVYVDSSGQFNRTCRCTEIYTNLSVIYSHPNGEHSNEIRYPIGCACVNISSNPGRRLNLDLVER